MKSLLIIIVSILTLGLNVQAQTRVRSGSTAPASYSFASTTVHEVVLSPSKIAIESYDHGKSRTDITVYGAYNYHFKENIQLGFEGGIVPGTDSRGNSKALMAALGVFTYNFETNFRDSFFAQGGLGLYPSYDKKDGDFGSELSFFGGFGRRWEMWGKINYMPYLRVWKKGDENASFEFQLLSFSIFY